MSGLTLYQEEVCPQSDTQCLTLTNNLSCMNMIQGGCCFQFVLDSGSDPLQFSAGLDDNMARLFF